MASKKAKQPAPKKVVRKKPTPSQSREDDDADWDADERDRQLKAAEQAVQPLKPIPSTAGRKSMLTSPHLADLAEEVTEEFLGYIRAGDFLKSAAGRAGLQHWTVVGWLKKGEAEIEAGDTSGAYAQFTQKVRIAEAERQSMLIGCVAQAAQFRDWKTGDPKHWSAATWLLERHDPKQFGPQIKLHVEQELGAALERLSKVLRPDEYEKALTALLSDDGGGTSVSTAPAAGERTEAAGEPAGLDSNSESSLHAPEAPEAADGPDTEGD